MSPAMDILLALSGVLLVGLCGAVALCVAMAYISIKEHQRSAS